MNEPELNPDTGHPYGIGWEFDPPTDAKPIEDMSREEVQQELERAGLAPAVKRVKRVIGLMLENRKLRARIALLEEAVREALDMAEGEWDAVKRHPASRHAGDVAYFWGVLNPAKETE